MKTQKLILYLTQEPEQIPYLVLDERNSVIECPNYGSLAELKVSAKDRQLIVLVPSEDILLTQVNIPSKLQSVQRTKAIPYALEERLWEDINALHFAEVQRNENNRSNEDTVVAVINHQKMEDWLARLKEAELKPTVIMPDCLAVPFIPNCWNVWIGKQVALIRINEEIGFGVDKDNLATMLEQRLSEAESEKPSSIQIQNYDDNHILTEDKFKSLNFEINIKQKKEDRYFALLKAAKQEEPVINLLQGKYATKESHPKSQKRIAIAAAVLTLLWLTVLIVGNSSQYFTLKNQQLALQEKIEKLYRKVYPKATQVVSPKLRLQQELKKLKMNQTDPVFFNLLTQVASTIQKISTIKLKHLAFRNDELELQLEANNFENLEQLSRKLKKQGLTVKQENVSKTDKAVLAQLVIRSSNN